MGGSKTDLRYRDGLDIRELKRQRGKMEWIYWAIVGAALVHIIEEYVGDWLGWVQRFVPGVTMIQFVIVNAVFVILCIAGAAVGTRSLVFGLSIASLIFINALVHIMPTVRTRHYSPGSVSAILLYIPLSACAFYLSAKSGQLTLR